MEVTYMLIVSVVTYILGAINKIFFETLPNRFIHIQNVIIGFISGFACDFTLYELRILFVSVNVLVFPIVVSIVFVLKLGLL